MVSVLGFPKNKDNIDFLKNSGLKKWTVFNFQAPSPWTSYGGGEYPCYSIEQKVILVYSSIKLDRICHNNLFLIFDENP